MDSEMSHDQQNLYNGKLIVLPSICLFCVLTQVMVLIVLFLKSPTTEVN